MTLCVVHNLKAEVFSEQFLGAEVHWTLLIHLSFVLADGHRLDFVVLQQYVSTDEFHFVTTDCLLLPSHSNQYIPEDACSAYCKIEATVNH